MNVAENTIAANTLVGLAIQCVPRRPPCWHTFTVKPRGLVKLIQDLLCIILKPVTVMYGGVAWRCRYHSQSCFYTSHTPHKSFSLERALLVTTVIVSSSLTGSRFYCSLESLCTLSLGLDQTFLGLFPLSRNPRKRE